MRVNTRARAHHPVGGRPRAPSLQPHTMSSLERVGDADDWGPVPLCVGSPQDAPGQISSDHPWLIPRTERLRGARPGGMPAVASFSHSFQQPLSGASQAAPQCSTWEAEQGPVEDRGDHTAERPLPQGAWPSATSQHDGCSCRAPRGHRRPKRLIWTSPTVHPARAQEVPPPPGGGGGSRRGPPDGTCSVVRNGLTWVTACTVHLITPYHSKSSEMLGACAAL